MPRSDRLYVFIVVAATSILVVGAIVATILTLTRDPKERPGYESAPAKELMKPNPTSGSIANVQNAERPPIDDQTYLVLHRESRLLARDLGSGKGYVERARRDGMPPDAIAVMAEKRRELDRLTSSMTASKKTPVIVYRPSPPASPRKDAELIATTNATVNFRPASIGADGGSMALTFSWRMLDNTWFLQEVQIDWTLEAGGSSGPSNPSESGETSDLEKQEEESLTEGIPTLKESNTDTPTSSTE